MAIIHCENLTKIYRSGFWKLKKVVAVNNLSLMINEGEIYGLLGPNGAGKTTTLKMLVGLARPTSGKVWIMKKEPKDSEVRKEIGFLPEQPYFYEYLNGYELVYLTSQMYGKEVSKKRIYEILELVGMIEAKDMYLKNYSRGMLQRIGLACCLVTDPKILILDEPMGGLDPIGRKEIRDLIIQLKKAGKTIIFSSHILSDAEMLCDRIGILIKGEKVKEGTISEIVGEEVYEHEIIFSQVPEVYLTEIKRLAKDLIKSGDKLMVICEDERKKEEILSLIQNFGGKIHSLIPRRKSLEEYFFTFMKEKRYAP
ncbi:MAG: ABC transporter ATP-binding protein [candidate division WOR-3 bacterium]|nr:ABC transporter ATP-binding protein [candidate division WOR-3 bacterium]MCX7836525.1 ABC transporter ATP-binding protein [candidate division WOR-3 bacterium]MDW8113763.1 ABC transporter ATP-binding protein [candidate division WOR-3 bacterium]